MKSLIMTYKYGLSSKHDSTRAVLFWLVGLMDECLCVCSWPAALNETRVQTNVTDVMTVQQPGEKAFQTQTITSMRTRAELPL